MEENGIQTGNRFSYKSIAILLLMLAMLGIFILLQGKDSLFNLSHQPRIKSGLPAPNFTFPGLDGKMVSLSDHRGKVVLLNIWATWCPPCVEEMPSIQRLYEELGGEDFEILAVSIDNSGAKVVAPFMKKYKLSFPALLNPEGTVQTLYGTTGVPESFIIDKEGILVQKVIGSRNWAAPEAIRFFRDLIRKPTSGT